MALSIKKKWEIVFLSKHRMGSQLGPTAISREVGCDVSTVKFWLKRYEETGDVEELERTGRPRKTIARQDEKIITTQESNREATATAILKEVRVGVSRETVRKRVREAGFKFEAPLVKPLLSDKHRKKRFQWARTTKTKTEVRCFLLIRPPSGCIKGGREFGGSLERK